MRDFSNKKTKELKEFYNQFIDSIPQNINKLKFYLNKETFSYEFTEIFEVENFYKNSLQKLSSLNISKEEFEDLVATYFGIACKCHLGGKWEIELDKKVDKYGHIYIDYYDYDYDTGWFIYPFSYTWFLESNQLKIGDISDSIKHLYDLQLKDEEKIKGYKIKPIKDIK
jgi:hypothetical protein